MQSSARATFSASMTGSTASSPFACGTPSVIRAVMSVAAFADVDLAAGDVVLAARRATWTGSVR